MGGRVTIWWLWAGVLSAGCNTLAGIDGDYVMAEGPLGGSGVGAQVGASGAGASWGEGGSYGAGGNAGANGASGANGVGGEGAPGGANGASGAAAAGGSAGTDPSDAGGGSGGTGDSDAAGGTGGTPCAPGQKRCGEECVEPGAAFGCSLTDCSPCPDPVPNSEVICGDEQCVAQCKQNFVPVGGQCVPQGSIDGGGGAGGGGGNGGSGGSRQCVVSECPSCSLFRGEACCTFFRTCGCSFADRIYCI